MAINRVNTSWPDRSSFHGNGALFNHLSRCLILSLNDILNNLLKILFHVDTREYDVQRRYGLGQGKMMRDENWVAVVQMKFRLGKVKVRYV